MASKKRRGRGRSRTDAIAVHNLRPSLARLDVLIAIALVFVTLGTYSQVLSHQFISLDDDVYISSNPMVTDGLTLRGFVWAFTTFHAANWHPLTWLSHMVDSQLFGLNAGAHLFVNAAIHCANGVLLFLFLKRVTGSRWESAIIAALFALHPLHVESVAWAAERKDTLSTCFGLLSFLAYARYVAQPSRAKYFLVALWLLLGLMTKPMLVSWPFVFLLLDYWPFRRLQWDSKRRMKQLMKDSLPLIREKFPLFCLIVPSMVVTYLAQVHGGAMIAGPISWRLANALVSYAKYLLLAFWPRDLAVFYPSTPEMAPLWQCAGALVLLSVITVVALQNAATRPYLIVGWLFFLGTLIPVIGLVRVGSQSMADRYTYVPSIGLFVALIFGLADFARRGHFSRTLITLASAGIIIPLVSLTARQLGRWRDGETLFRYALSVTSENPVMHFSLGYIFLTQGKVSEATTHFAEAVRIKPHYTEALVHQGLALRKLGKIEEALFAYERAFEVEPNSVRVRWQLGETLDQMGRTDDALSHFNAAIRLAPLDAGMRTDFGVILGSHNKFKEAAEQFMEALRLDPNNAEAHNHLGFVFLATGEPSKALEEFTAAFRLKPDLAGIESNLQQARERLSREGQ